MVLRLIGGGAGVNGGAGEAFGVAKRLKNPIFSHHIKALPSISVAVNERPRQWRILFAPTRAWHPDFGPEADRMPSVCRRRQRIRTYQYRWPPCGPFFLGQLGQNSSQVDGVTALGNFIPFQFWFLPGQATPPNYAGCVCWLVRAAR